MTGALVDPDTAELRTADGRIPGRRGRATRRRLLDATHELLERMPHGELRVIEITRRAGTSSATFYQYFSDIESAVLVLAAEVADDGATRLRRLVEGPDWHDSGAAAARALASGFLGFFESERALLRTVDLAALEGDERFRALRTRLLNGVFVALRDLVQESRARDVVDDATDPEAVAGVLTSMLAHVAAHQPGLSAWGVGGDELVTTMATIVDRSVRADRDPIAGGAGP